MVWKQPINKIFNKDLLVEKKDKKNSQNYIFEKKNNFFNFFFKNKFVKKKSTLDLNSYKITNKNNNFLSFFLIFLVLFWIVSSFYIISESERGVVTNFGKFTYIAKPGLNWIPKFIGNIFPVNIKEIKTFSSTGLVSTTDENVLNVKINVQYKIVNPKNYLFSVVSPDSTFKQVANSVLFDTMRNCSTYQILFKKKTLIDKKIKNKIRKITKNQKLGIKILNINFWIISSPYEIRNIISKVFTAEKEKQEDINQAKKYFIQKQFNSSINEKKILEQAKEYKKKIFLQVKEEINYFSKIFLIYKKSKEMVQIHLYSKFIEKIFSHSKKIFIDKKSDNFFLSLDNLYSINNNFFEKIRKNKKIRSFKNKFFSSNIKKKIRGSSKNLYILKNNILEQRRINSLRKNIF
ncbi:Modulator of FtsH protease HflK [Buchnera aphidicola (Mindarus abietinus)]